MPSTVVDLSVMITTNQRTRHDTSLSLSTPVVVRHDTSLTKRIHFLNVHDLRLSASTIIVGSTDMRLTAWIEGDKPTRAIVSNFNMASPREPLMYPMDTDGTIPSVEITVAGDDRAAEIFSSDEIYLVAIEKNSMFPDNNADGEKFRTAYAYSFDYNVYSEGNLYDIFKLLSGATAYVFRFFNYQADGVDKFKFDTSPYRLDVPSGVNIGWTLDRIMIMSKENYNAYKKST